MSQFDSMTSEEKKQAVLYVMSLSSQTQHFPVTGTVKVKYGVTATIVASGNEYSCSSDSLSAVTGETPGKAYTNFVTQHNLS